MKDEGKAVSMTKLCCWFELPRSTLYYKNVKRPRKETELNIELEKRIKQIIEDEPTYGLRFITAILKKDYEINRKRVHRLIKKNSWQRKMTPKGHRPRVKKWKSLASRSNERWAVDTTHIFTQKSGWTHLTAILDCYDRELIGWRISSSGKAKVAAAALEDAIRNRKPGAGIKLRSDNGLVFGAKDFLKAAQGMEKEYITPYTPEQNGMIERFFRTLKEECIWRKQPRDIDEAFSRIADWIDNYNNVRPHSALGYLPPKLYKEKLVA